jgi:hypothetical protein
MLCWPVLLPSAAAADTPPVPGEGIALAELFPGARFDPAIPTQQALLGVEPGARPLRHAELIRYLETLAEASPRAELRTYSHTHEGRRMVILAVSDAGTIGRLDAFREEHLRRVDPRGRSAEQDAELVADAQAVAWMAYGIHGDELSSADAAAALAYWLVAGEDERAQALRRELVILIDPLENPDGRERYLAQTTAFAHLVPNPDGEDLSHTAVWPWGRGNHYLFDLNRDWFSMVHPESRRSAVIASWEPQLMVDSHEMGQDDTYLFSPPRHPFNPHLPPSHFEWWQRFGADQARALDARGYPYYTREWNEEFFPGYGSSWAAYRGAVGILYEMSETAGTVIRKRSGTLRSYAQAVEHQVTSSVANLGTLAGNREMILGDFIADRRAAIQGGREGALSAWVLPESSHPERTRRLVRLLRGQGIEVLRATSSPPQVAGLRDILTGESVDAATLPDATWLVPLDQPVAPLVRTLLDPHVPMEAEFLREEREYLERGKGTRLYETTSWSLPLCYGVEAYWTAQRPGQGWAEQEVPDERGAVEAAGEPVGYLIAGASDRAILALADLLQRELRVQVAEKPFRVEGSDYGRGTLLLTREGNPEDLAQQLGQVAERRKVRVRAVSTAKAERGPDLGGRHFKPIVSPRVGIWSGSSVSPSAYGALWHLLDHQANLRFSGLDLSRYKQTDLNRYNVLIFPTSRAGARAYTERLGEEGVRRLKHWIEAGGTAIGIGAGAEFLADTEVGLTRTRLRRQALDRYPPAVLGPTAEEAERAGPFRAVGLRTEPPRDDAKEAQRSKESARREPAVDERTSPYDVAPLVGPGARPFTEGFELGTPVEMKPVDLATWLEPLLPPRADADDKRRRRRVDEEDLERADERLRRFRPRGVFLRVDLDPEVWLTWGMGREVPALTNMPDTLVAEPPVQVAARFADPERLHLGGLLWPEAAGRVARTAYATREETGRGQVILFLSEPEFRGWTLGTRRLLLNAILYGPGLGTRWSTPW